MALATNDIESELSYAYLHAVASRVGCECQMTGRHSDGMGVDARLFVDEDFGAEAIQSRFTVEFQLKASSRALSLVKGRYSYRLRKDYYDKLRRTDIESPLLLVVLQLPKNPQEWLRCTPQALTLKRCAYWVSLYNAPASTNESYQTVHLPRANLFSGEMLRGLLARFARRERITYDV
jgi:hypothetical protein